MGRRRRQSRRPSSSFSRRRLLFLVGGGSLLGFSVLETEAFSVSGVPRRSEVSAAADENALVGLDVSSSVTENSRDQLVRVSNNTGHHLTITVSLGDCSHGVLYDGQGDSGCSVTFTLATSDTSHVDLEAAVGQLTVPFSISARATTGFSLETTRQTFVIPADVVVCPRTLGFWSTHCGVEGACPADDGMPWPIAGAEDFEVCGVTWLEVLQTPVRSDHWKILAKQWIVAQLNVAAGVDAPMTVQNAIAEAGDLLEGDCGSLRSSDFDEFKDTLGAFNEGEFSPECGSEDEDDDEENDGDNEDDGDDEDD